MITMNDNVYTLRDKERRTMIPFLEVGINDCIELYIIGAAYGFGLWTAIEPLFKGESYAEDSSRTFTWMIDEQMSELF